MKMPTAVREPKPRTAAISGNLNGAAVNGAGVDGAVVGAPRLSLTRRQRRPGYVALFVVLVVGLAGVGGWLYSTAGKKVAVVVVVHDVPVGQVIDRSDLSTAQVAGEVTAIAGARLDSVVGQRAAVELLPGTLLQRAMVTAGPVLEAGQAQVGVAVRGGQLPADGLTAGDVVQVWRLPAPTTGAAAPGTAALVAARAAVFAARPDPAQAGGWLVTLTIPADAAAAVAAASGSGTAALVRVAS